MRIIKQNEYDDVLKEHENIIVQLSADWCGPCRILTPVLESVAEDCGITVVKVNIDNCPEIVKRYSVRSIPRILFIKDGKVKDDLHGNQKHTKLKTVCQQVYGD
tara:strand:- start:76 stop:387 length:312 start_codon:yes stop_codon:yes gene_type:complete